MSDALTGILIGIAALVAAFYIGSKNQKSKQKIAQLEQKNDQLHKINKVIEDNCDIDDVKLRKWLRDNAKQ